MSRRTHQGKIIHKMIRYFEVKEAAKAIDAPLSDEEKVIWRQGLCYGFSICNAYMCATGKGAWWKGLLQVIMDWDEQLGTLKNVVALPDARFGKLTLEMIFQYALNFLPFSHARQNIIGIDNLLQLHFLRPGIGLFDSEHGKICSYVCFGGSFTDEQIEQLLSEAVFSSSGIHLICSHSHVATVRFEEGVWYFHDPNIGDMPCDSKQALISELTMRLGHALIFELASWDVQLQDAYNRLYDYYLFESASHFSPLLQDGGLYALLRTHPEHLGTLLLEANDDDIKDFLKALQRTIGRNKTTPFHFIAKKLPHAIDFIICCAQKDFISGYLFCQALQTINREGVSPLDIIQVVRPELMSLIDVITTDVQQVISNHNHCCQERKQTLAQLPLSHLFFSRPTDHVENNESSVSQFSVQSHCY